MISDYYKILTKRTVTQISDGAGGFTESTTDVPFKGYISVLSGNEVIRSKQMGLNASARLLTDGSIDVTDRVVDGSTVYEVVFPYNQHHKYYDLKLV